MKMMTEQDFVPKSQRHSLFARKDEYTLWEYAVELYHATSGNKFKEIDVPPELLPFTEYVYIESGYSAGLIKSTKKLKLTPLGVKYGRVLHLATGGKDSTSNIIKTFQHDPTLIHDLIHIRGVNKIYPKEGDYAEALFTKYFLSAHPKSFVYHPIKVHFSRVTGPESPVKNFIMFILALESLGYIPEYFTFGGENTNSDISEVEVLGDRPHFMDKVMDLVKVCYGSQPKDLSLIESQQESYKLCHDFGIHAGEMASCMCQLRFKPLQRRMVLDKYALEIDGKIVLSGTNPDGTSIFDNKPLTLDLVTEVDAVLPDTDYRCLKCFKCNERVLVNHTHFGYKYHPSYVEDAKRLIITWMDKSPNNNLVNIRAYFEETLGIPLGEIPSRYHGYILGEKRFAI